MGFLKRVILEVHRRSIWQVLAVYLAGSWVAIQVVGELTRTAGLPDWVPPAALVLLVIGLPVVLATAVVQEGAPSTGRDSRSQDPLLVLESSSVPAESASGSASARAASADSAEPRSPADSFLARHLTWRRSLLAGVAAFALLGVAVTGYFVMRVAGIGPVATLIAQGAIDEGEPIVLADFENTTNDPALGATVGGAIRADLAGSPVLTLFSDGQVREVLGRMGRNPDIPLDAGLAREVAVREGLKAVLDGSIGAAGSGYILTATLRAAETGEALATSRQTARSEDDLIDAIDALSRDIRERAGESLRTVRGGPPLSQVTTGSLSALQRYVEGERLFNRGDELGALALLEQAVELDPEFAMAWRKLAVTLGNLQVEDDRRLEAIERAFELRDRLTEKERYLTEALYHGNVAEDQAAEQRAYENVLRLDPSESAALNNLALIYSSQRRYDRAEELYRRSVEGRGEASGVIFQNLVGNQIWQGRFDEALVVLDEFEARLPGDPRSAEVGFWAHAFAGDVRAAESRAAVLADDLDLPPTRRLAALGNLAGALAVQGRLSEAERRFAEAASFSASSLGPGAAYEGRLVQAAVMGTVTRDRDRTLQRLADVEAWGRQAGLSGTDLAPAIHLILRFDLDDPRGVREILDQIAEEVDGVPDPELSARLEFYRHWLDEGRDDPASMLEALERLEEATDCQDRRCYGDWKARFLEAAGRTAEALDEWKALPLRPQPNWVYSLALVPVTLQETARVAELVGDTATAVEAYEAFIDLWRDADPELQPRVQAARGRLAALSGSP